MVGWRWVVELSTIFPWHWLVLILDGKPHMYSNFSRPSKERDRVHDMSNNKKVPNTCIIYSSINLLFNKIMIKYFLYRRFAKINCTFMCIFVPYILSKLFVLYAKNEIQEIVKTQTKRIAKRNIKMCILYLCVFRSVFMHFVVLCVTIEWFWQGFWMDLKFNYFAQFFKKTFSHVSKC